MARIDSILEYNEHSIMTATTTFHDDLMTQSRCTCGWIVAGFNDVASAEQAAIEHVDSVKQHELVEELRAIAQDTSDPHTVVRLLTLINDLEDVDVCDCCGAEARPNDPISDHVISPPVSGYSLDVMHAHESCAAQAARESVM